MGLIWWLEWFSGRGVFECGLVRVIFGVNMYSQPVEPILFIIFHTALELNTALVFAFKSYNDYGRNTNIFPKVIGCQIIRKCLSKCVVKTKLSSRFNLRKSFIGSWLSTLSIFPLLLRC